MWIKNSEKFCSTNLKGDDQRERKGSRAMQDKIDEIVQSLDFLLETDPRTFSNPCCEDEEDERVYHAIAEAIKILKSVT